MNLKENNKELEAYKSFKSDEDIKRMSDEKEKQLELEKYENENPIISK